MSGVELTAHSLQSVALVPVIPELLEGCSAVLPVSSTPPFAACRTDQVLGSFALPLSKLDLGEGFIYL